MPEFLFSNFGQSALSAPLAHDETTMLVSPSDAQRFPEPGQDQVFALVLMDGRNEPEIVWVVDNPLTGHLVVQRGREGTPAINWGVGTVALHTHTKDSLEWFVTGGQILWKNQFQAELDALRAMVLALKAAEDAREEVKNGQVNYLESRIEQSFATISENWQVVTDFNYAMSSITQTLTADVASNHAELITFKQVTAGSFGAQALLNTELEARTNNAVATANESLQATVDLDSALVVAKQDYTAKFGLNSGQITNLQQADVDNYSALSQAINTVAANYGPLSATVTVKSIALADLTDAVGGAFSVDINTSTGAFAGFRIVAGTGAGTTISYAKFNVNQFILDSPAGSANPFVYDAVNGWLSVQNLRVHGQFLYNGSVDGQLKAEKDTFTTGEALFFAPNVQFGPGPEAGGSYTDVQSFSYTTKGGRVRFNIQMILANPDATKFLDARVNFLVNGGVARYYAFKGLQDFGHSVSFAVTVYLPPGSHTFSFSAGTYSGPGAGQGTYVGTVQAIWVDIDDFSTES